MILGRFLIFLILENNSFDENLYVLKMLEALLRITTKLTLNICFVPI